MSIPLLDLGAQLKPIRAEVEAAIAGVLDHGKFILGPEVQQLEQKIAEYCQCRYAVACASGSDALLLSLMALDLTQGDAVITTPYTFFATAGSIARLGARPIFIDIEHDTYNIDPQKLEAYLKSCPEAERKSIKAIIPVHLFGQCADMDAIMRLAAEYNLPVIEDAAQAIGAEYRGRRAGSIGLAGCFSFFPSKNLGCFGDGGMMTTNDAAFAERLRILRVHGSKPKYYHKLVGCNSRLDTVHAAVLLVKLRYLDNWTAGRQRNAALYRSLFDVAASGVETPVETSGGRHIYNQFVIRTRRRDELMAALKTAGIGCEVYYPVPLHLQECFAYCGYRKGDFPESEAAALESLALPIYPELDADGIAAVADAVLQASRQQVAF